MHSMLRLAVFLAFLLAPCDGLGAWPRDESQAVPICIASGQQWGAVAVADGGGGAWVCWLDTRSSPVLASVYVHHLLATGLLDPQWPAQGVVASSTAGGYRLVLTADGAGGVIVAWTDSRNVDTNGDVYAHHVRADGTLDPAWPVGGRALCRAPNFQGELSVASDGAGGAIVAWQDQRTSYTDLGVYAQRVRADGTLDPRWPVDGRALCTGRLTRNQLVSVPDTCGGAITAWWDARVGYSDTDIYAMRVRADGELDAAWPAQGRAVCGQTGEQNGPAMVADGAGGAIVAWHDFRYLNTSDVYAHHLRENGTLDSAWPVGGLLVSGAPMGQYGVRMSADGGGGAVVAWSDARAWPAYHFYAQRVRSGGVVDARWPVNGRALCTADFMRDGLLLTSDEAGGALATWTDRRNGEEDIYAARVLEDGTIAPGWPANGRPVRTGPGDQRGDAAVSDGRGGIIVVFEEEPDTPESDLFAQRVTAMGNLGDDLVGVAGIPGPKLSLSLLGPNPVHAGVVRVRILLPAPGPASLELYDVAGRELVREDLSDVGPGGRELGLGPHALWRPGVYLLVLRQGAASRVARVAVLR